MGQKVKPGAAEAQFVYKNQPAWIFFYDPARYERLGVELAPGATLFAVVEGQTGYYSIASPETADELNPEFIPAEVLEAALMGSIFGWDAPIALPAILYAAVKRYK